MHRHSALLSASSPAIFGCCSADHIVRVAEAVAGNLQAEISAGDRLRDLLQPRRWVGQGCIQPARHICMAPSQLADC